MLVTAVRESLREASSRRLSRLNSNCLTSDRSERHKGQTLPVLANRVDFYKVVAHDLRAFDRPLDE